MKLPDFTQSTEQLRRHLPQLVYSSVEEAAETNRRRIEQNVAFFRANPDGLEARLEELSLEWDADRVLQVAASGGSLVGFALWATKSRMWLLLPMALSACALHHALTGTSPAIDFIRRLGFRTRQEIEEEMMALDALRHEAEARKRS